MVSRPAMQGPDKKGLTAPCKVSFSGLDAQQLRGISSQFVCNLSAAICSGSEAAVLRPGEVAGEAAGVRAAGAGAHNKDCIKCQAANPTIAAAGTGLCSGCEAAGLRPREVAGRAAAARATDAGACLRHRQPGEEPAQQPSLERAHSCGKLRPGGNLPMASCFKGPYTA